MNKLWLIIKREFLTRVTKKAFILGTFLTPLGIGLLIFINVKLMGYKDDNVKKIVLSDPYGIVPDTLKGLSNITLSHSDLPLDSLKAQVTTGQFNGVLAIPNIGNVADKSMVLKYYSDDKLGIEMTERLADKIADIVKKYKLTALNIDLKQVEALDTNIKVDPDPINGKEDASTVSSLISLAIGGGMGFIMYLSVFIYGMMIFRSVMEEKTSRIVEVMISSVKPFQLMLGKIIGVGAAGLAQFIVWAVLISVISTGVMQFSGDDSAAKMAAMQKERMAASGANVPEISASESPQILTEFMNQDWLTLIPLFLLFFILGYLLYSSLFAAVGSAVGDDVGESQSLTLPITIPVILAIYIMFAAIRAPDSSLAVWSSLFPLFSPIVMPARLPFHPPAWQIALSLVLLAATVVGLVWLAGRIYRVGILMYGKKVTFKELGKWLFYKD